MRANVQHLGHPDCESKPGFGLCIRQVRCMYQAISGLAGIVLCRVGGLRGTGCEPIRASCRVEIGRDRGFVYMLGSASLKEARAKSAMLVVISASTLQSGSGGWYRWRADTVAGKGKGSEDMEVDR